MEKEHPLAEWVKKQPKWQQYALRSIAKYGSAESIPQNEEIQIKKMLAEEARGEMSSSDSAYKFYIPDTTDAKPKTYLKSLGPVSSIDKLTSEQDPFVFVSPNGMTVIFGNNGSGKSGYARILKNLCRSHGNIESIKGDVTSTSQLADWEVDLTYAEKNGKEEVITPIKWSKVDEDKVENYVKYTPLKRISFFDNKVANVYVDEDRELFYFPFEIRLYSELAFLADRLKKQLNEKVKEIEKNLPNLPEMTEGTTSKSIIFKLKKWKIAEVTKKELNSICFFSEKEEQELRKLKDKKEQTPDQQKVIFERMKKMLELVKQHIESLSTSSLKKLLVLHTNYQTAKKNAEQGIVDLAQDQDMPIRKAIGSVVWFEMFKAARAFAGEVYPGVSLSPIANGDYCVLCHQKLEENARNRLKKFDDFMDQVLQKAANEAKDVYEKSKGMIMDLSDLDLDAITQQLQKYAALSSVQEEQISLIISDINAITWRFREVKKIIKTGDFDGLHALIDKEFQAKVDISSLINGIKDKEKQIETLISKGVETFSTEEQSRFFELLDKEKCFNREDDIRKYFDLLQKRNHLLHDYESLLNTAPVTRQSTKRSNELFSDALKARYTKEIRRLRLEYLGISVGSKGKKGIPKIKVNMEGLEKEKKSEILSEGEQKGIALAGFLTEINEMNVGHAIVFDDPISSLDWDRRKLIVNRLVEEAKKRQVIVFTHDFSFALQLEKKCEDKNGGNAEGFFKKLFIEKRSNGPVLEFGIIEKDVVAWEFKNVNTRINDIRKEINDLEKKELQPDDSEFETKASNITKKLRKTWERAVEEVVFKNTIRRLSPDVNTLCLKEVCFHGKEDYLDLHEGMSFMSEFPHDAPECGGNASPDLEQLRENTNLLENWVDKLRDKQKKMKKEKKRFMVQKLGNVE